MPDIFSRSARLWGAPALSRLSQCSVAVFGLGGVGSYVCEALARGGVGRLVIVDSDTVDPSNINRQLIALHSTLGQRKTDVMRRRLLDINPRLWVEAHPIFYTAETAGQVDFSRLDYIADAIDTVSSKLLIIERAARAGVPVISAMGTGNKMDPLQLRTGDIYETSGCPLARVMRRELRKRGISSLRVVYSTEPPMTPLSGELQPSGRRCTPGSLPFVPSAAGLIMASEILSVLAGISPRCTSRR